MDLKSATSHGVTVFNAPYSNTRSVAELVIGLSILLIRRIPDKSKAAHEGIWLKEAKGSYELRGKTLGIIGYGNIGTQVSILAEGMGMKVIFYDTVTKLPLGNAEAKKTLKEVVSQADIVTLHVPETAQTKNLITKAVLKQFKKAPFCSIMPGERWSTWKPWPMPCKRDNYPARPSTYILGNQRRTATGLRLRYRVFPT